MLNLFLTIILLFVVFLKFNYAFTLIMALFSIFLAFLKKDFSKKIAPSWKFRIFLIIVLFITACFLPFQNIIYNGDFEKPIFGWQSFSQIFKNSEGSYSISNVSIKPQGEIRRRGNKALYINNKQESGDQRYGICFQPIIVLPNASYKLHLYVKGNIENESLWISINDDWANNNGRYFVAKGEYLAWTGINPATRLIPDDAGYANFKIISTVPGSYYIDDISLRLDLIDTIKRYIKKILRIKKD